VPVRCLDEGAGLAHVVGASHEGEGDEVQVLLDGHRDVHAVLLRDGGEIHRTPGRFDVLAGAELPAVEDPALEAMLAHAEHLQVDEAVVDRHPLAHLQVFHQIAVVDVDASHLGVVGRTEK